MPCLVTSERIHSLRARATASFSACSSSGSRFSSRRRSRACWRSSASTWASSASCADALGAARAVGHLLLDREPRPRQLALAREVADQLLVLPHLARAVAGDEAGAGVNQRGAPHPLGEGDDVLGALDVGAQRRLERRVERHAPRRVDEHVDVLGDPLGQLLGQAEVRLGDVAVDDHHLLAQERRQRLLAAVLVAQRIERRRGHDALPEARLAVGARAAPHHHVGAADLGKPVEQHAEQHLARRTRCCRGSAPCGRGRSRKATARAPRGARRSRRCSIGPAFYRAGARRAIHRAPNRRKNAELGGARRPISGSRRLTAVGSRRACARGNRRCAAGLASLVAGCGVLAVGRVRFEQHRGHGRLGARGRGRTAAPAAPPAEEARARTAVVAAPSAGQRRRERGRKGGGVSGGGGGAGTVRPALGRRRRRPTTRPRWSATGRHLPGDGAHAQEDPGDRERRQPGLRDRRRLPDRDASTTAATLFSTVTNRGTKMHCNIAPPPNGYDWYDSQGRSLNITGGPAVLGSEGDVGMPYYVQSCLMPGETGIDHRFPAAASDGARHVRGDHELLDRAHIPAGRRAARGRPGAAKLRRRRRRRIPGPFPQRRHRRRRPPDGRVRDLRDARRRRPAARRAAPSTNSRTTRSPTRWRWRVGRRARATRPMSAPRPSARTSSSKACRRPTHDETKRRRDEDECPV